MGVRLILNMPFFDIFTILLIEQYLSQEIFKPKDNQRYQLLDPFYKHISPIKLTDLCCIYSCGSVLIC